MKIPRVFCSVCRRCKWKLVTIKLKSNLILDINLNDYCEHKTIWNTSKTTHSKVGKLLPLLKRWLVWWNEVRMVWSFIHSILFQWLVWFWIKNLHSYENSHSREDPYSQNIRNHHSIRPHRHVICNIFTYSYILKYFRVMLIKIFCFNYIKRKIKVVPNKYKT